MEIVPGIHVHTVGKGRFVGVSPPNVYLILGGQRVVMVDAGYDKEEELKERDVFLASLGNPSISSVILTHRHPDHIGGASHFHRDTGGILTCAPQEQEAVNKGLKGATVGKVVADGETLDIGGATLEFIHAPGHTLGSLCVFLREQKILFTGDTILGTGTTVINDSEGNMASYLDTLRKLLSYDAQMILPGHGPVVRNPRAKINELISHRLEREQQVMEALRGGCKSIADLLHYIYPELDRRLHDMARSQTRSHLTKLEKEGLVARVGGEGPSETWEIRG